MTTHPLSRTQKRAAPRPWPHPPAPRSPGRKSSPTHRKTSAPSPHSLCPQSSSHAQNSELCPTPSCSLRPQRHNPEPRRFYNAPHIGRNLPRYMTRWRIAPAELCREEQARSSWLQANEPRHSESCHSRSEQQELLFEEQGTPSRSSKTLFPGNLSTGKSAEQPLSLSLTLTFRNQEGLQVVADREFVSAPHQTSHERPVVRSGSHHCVDEHKRRCDKNGSRSKF